jgi:hypothetical protein
MENSENVSPFQMRTLMHEIKELQPHILCRFRLIAEMWQLTFLQIVKLTELGGIFCNPSTGQFVEVKDLNNIMQFELDSPFQQYRPHFHYTINPLVNQDNNYADTSS